MISVSSVRRTSMYLPRRPISFTCCPTMRRPNSSTLGMSSVRSQKMIAPLMVSPRMEGAPAFSPSSVLRMVSTSGSSGILPLRLQNAHDDDVPVMSVLEMRLPLASLHHKSYLLIRTDRPQVVLKNL